MSQQLQISSSFIAMTVVAIGCMIVLPLVAGFIAHRRLGVSWRYFGYGALIFFLFQIVTRVPAVQVAQALLAPQLQASLPLRIGWAVFLALTAGLFEEVGRYVGYRWLMRNDTKTWSKGVMYGLGHGGIESILLVGGLATAQLIGLLALQGGAAAQLPPEQRVLAQQQLAAVAALPSWMPLLGAWERLCALAFHTALSLVVLQVFQRGSLRWLALAIGLHALIDLLPLVTLLGLPPLTAQYLSEGLLTLVAAASVWGILKLRDTPANEPSPTLSPIAR